MDSFREVAPDGTSHPLDRSVLRIVQTPQVFRADLLRRAYKRPYNPDFTDDATVVEASGAAVELVEGEALNLKITTHDDLAMAEALLARRKETA